MKMLGGISIWQLLIVLLIVVLFFGTKKLRNMGSDLGAAVKGFKNSVSDDKDADFEHQEAVENKSSQKAETTQTKTEQKEPQ